MQTTFRRNTGTGQWSWHTQAVNGQIVATGGETYVTLDGARNGFLSNCGYSNWNPGDPLPLEFSETKINDNEYIVDH